MSHIICTQLVMTGKGLKGPCGIYLICNFIQGRSVNVEAGLLWNFCDFRTWQKYNSGKKQCQL